jgi:hypothetical protein
MVAQAETIKPGALSLLLKFVGSIIIEADPKDVFAVSDSNGFEPSRVYLIFESGFEAEIANVKLL